MQTVSEGRVERCRKGGEKDHPTTHHPVKHFFPLSGSRQNQLLRFTARDSRELKLVTDHELGVAGTHWTSLKALF